MKTYRIFTCILAAGICIAASGQSNSKEVLALVEANNLTLRAARAGAEAEIAANRSEALLGNPEIEFNLLDGGELGGRHDLRISQSFDIPTLTGMRSKMVEGLNEMSGLRYRSIRQDVLLEAKLTCTELVHANALACELSTHHEDACALVANFEKRLAAGESSILDLNKAKVHLASVKAKISRNEMERQRLLSKLRTLNGGREIKFTNASYDIEDELPADFASWLDEVCQTNPSLSLARQEVSTGRKDLQISKASWLPEISVGYMSEIRTAEKFRGVTLGMSIPLWSNANRVKKNRAAVVAAEERRDSAEKEFISRLQALYSEALAQKEAADLLRSSVVETDNREYLLKAESKGEISMVDYLVEIDLYYDALEEALEAELSYRLALAMLESATF